MPETNEERRTRQSAIEQASRARLHGVEMPEEVRFQCQKATSQIIVLQNFGKKRARGQCESKQSANVDGTRGMCQT